MGNTGGIIRVAGKSSSERRSIQRRAQRGELVWLAKGSYMEREHFENLEYLDKCLARIVATALATKKSVLAGRTAAFLLGLPHAGARMKLDTPVEVCGFSGSDQRSQHVIYHRLARATYQRIARVSTRFGSVYTTDVATTCVDLARWYSVDDGLLALEYCLNNARQADLAGRFGSSPRPASELRDRYAARSISLNDASRMPSLRLTEKQYEDLTAKIDAANLRSSNLRTVLRLATAYSESPAESRTKLQMFRMQNRLRQRARSTSAWKTKGDRVGGTYELPTPLQQVPVHFHDGTQFRLDFYFPRHVLGVEYDGEGKHRGEFGVEEADALREGWNRHTRLNAAGIELFHVSRDADPRWPEQLVAALAERARRLEISESELSQSKSPQSRSLASRPLRGETSRHGERKYGQTTGLRGEEALQLRGDVGLGRGVPAWAEE